MKAPRKKDEAPPESDVFPGAPPPRMAMQLFGQNAAEAALLDAYKSGRMHHAWILGGRPGVGKATLAWRLARFLIANPDAAAPAARAARDLSVTPDSKAAHLVASLSAPDLLLLRREWNSERKRHFTEIRIDDARRALNLFHHNAAAEGGWRICIVDAADDLNRASANALLKLIEEPPEKSLFLLISHSPGRLLPTIRSRCRRLPMEALSEGDIARVVHSLGAPWSDHKEKDVAEAAASANGSAQEALRLLGRVNAASARLTEEILAGLPQVNWEKAQALADDVGKVQNEQGFDAMLDIVYRWLHAKIRAARGAGPRRLAPYAQAWEKIEQAAREVETYNLDKRAFVFAMIEDLAAAAG
ncbi:MAG: DNA polymerase III subunit delta' [Hyphomicrobiales bacterium]|nr:DNA polymerase III subunit delta' [Hyphomicrobiales bacterium]